MTHINIGTWTAPHVFFYYGSRVIFSNNHSIPKSRLNRSNCDLRNGDKNLLAVKPKSKFVKKKELGVCGAMSWNSLSSMHAEQIESS